ncbi:unnamed protein product [Prunus armeniaca]|uniref:HMA domain-containing protein n=1 Tax=Prunus armeniaca TaxID=36596 RepID=A0A6J5X9N4_PRUAR|nr:unnamed protein product [Prunus armeniaca]
MSNPKTESVTMHEDSFALIREDDFEQNSLIIDSGGAEDESCCAVPEPPSATVALDVLNVQGTQDVILETFGSPYYLQSINDKGTMILSHHSRAYSFESLDDEDLVCVSPAPYFTAMEDDPTAYFHDFSTSYLKDGISYVSEDANAMAHFHDSFVFAAGDKSSYFPLGNPVKFTQTHMQQKLELKMSAGVKTMKKVKKVVHAIKESGTVQLHNDPSEIEDSCDVLEPPQLEVGLSVQGTRDVNETLDSAAKIEVGVKRIEGSEDVQGQTDMGIGEPMLPTLETPYAENEVTEYVPSTVTIDLDVLLRELKRKLLKDEESTLVLTGPRGCGKTKLAKRNCQDKLKICSRTIPELQEDTIALKWLQVFLNEAGQHPSLLVLDDVWPESEPILDKFDNFKTSNYKIMMTSRSEFPTFGSPYYLQSIYDEGTRTFSHHSRAYSFESLDDEDLVCVSPALSFTAMDDDPTAYFRDFSTFYLKDRISHVSEDTDPMTHFHDSSASTTRDRSSYVSKGVGIKFPLGNPVKSTQTYMQQKLELNVSTGVKTVKKVMKVVHVIKGVSSTGWDAKNQKLTVVGQLDPVLMVTKLRKMASKTELISVGPSKEEI